MSGLFSLPSGAPKDSTWQAAPHRHEDQHQAHLAQSKVRQQGQVQLSWAAPSCLGGKNGSLGPHRPLRAGSGLPRGPPWCEGRGPGEDDFREAPEPAARGRDVKISAVKENRQILTNTREKIYLQDLGHRCQKTQ